VAGTGPEPVHPAGERPDDAASATGATASEAANGSAPEIVQRTFESGVETVVPSLDLDHPAGMPAFRARACLPIRSRDGAVSGVLDVLLRDPIAPAGLDVLRAAVADLAARIAAEADRATEPPAQRMLRHVARLSGLHEPDVIARTVLTAALDLTGLDSAALLRPTADGQLRTLASIGPLAAAVRGAAPDALEAVTAAADGTARVIAGATTDGDDATPQSLILSAAGTRAVVFAGLVADGEPQGLLLLAGDAPAPALPDDLQLLEALGANAATCLQTADLLRSLRERAATDPLTGLGHHATFHETLADSHRRPRTAVVICDLDGFKRHNDSYGHQHGDEVLRAVAGALSGALRRGDSLFRIGGDEFAALLAVSDAHEALEAGRRLRDAVRRAGLGVTVSVGVAVPREDEADASVLARADRALYRVKASGRDGVALAADEPLPIAPPV
jgi:diguanylate cyclase (GGDEF)-like protein